jgi:FixJ family two-component response regulator
MKRVLVCDDEKDVLYNVTFALTGLGWDVHTCTDCNDIIGKVKEIIPSVIVIDYQIPGVSGMIATQLLKSDIHWNHIPVVFFTGHGDIVNLSEKSGAEFSLQKPFDIRKLANVMSEAYRMFKKNNPNFSLDPTTPTCNY